MDITVIVDGMPPQGTGGAQYQLLTLDGMPCTVYALSMLDDSTMQIKARTPVLQAFGVLNMTLYLDNSTLLQNVWMSLLPPTPSIVKTSVSFNGSTQNWINRGSQIVMVSLTVTNLPDGLKLDNISVALGGSAGYARFRLVSSKVFITCIVAPSYNG